MMTPRKTRAKPASLAAKTPSTTTQEGISASGNTHAAGHTEPVASTERPPHGSSPCEPTPPIVSAQRALKLLEYRAFTDDFLATSQIPFSKQDHIDNKMHTDPSTLDFLVLMQGREFIQESVRSTGHTASLTKTRERNHTPISLQAPRNIRLYKPRLHTTLQIRSLQA